MGEFICKAFFIFFYFVQCISFAQHVPGSYHVQNYDPQLYDGHFQNWSIVQGNDGLMYFANNSRVLEFDGKNWRAYQIRNNSKVLSLAVDQKGIVYVGGIGEFGYLGINKAGEKEYISLSNKLPKEQHDFKSVWRIIANEKGVYFKTQSNIFHYYNGQLDSNSAPLHYFFYGINNKILIADSTGINIMVGSEFYQLPRTGSLNSTDNSLVHPILVKNKKLLFVTRQNGLFSYDLEGLFSDSLTLKNISNKNYPRSILKHMPSEADNYLQKYEAYHAIRINDHKIAIATLGGGIVLLDDAGKLISIINMKSGLIDDRVYYLYKDQQENLWAATNYGISLIIANSPFTYFDSQNGFNTGVLTTVRYQDRLYTSTYSSLYLKDKEDHFKLIFDKPIWSFYEYQNDLYAGSTKGLYQIDGDSYRLLHQTNSTINDISVSSKFPDHLLLSSNMGILPLEIKKEDKNSLGHQWTTINGTDADAFKDFPYITNHISVDDEGDLWVSTENHGVYLIQFNGVKLRQHSIIQYDTLDGLPSNSRNVAYYHKGQVLIATVNGIYEVSGSFRKNNADQVKFGPSERYNCLSSEDKSISELSFDDENIYVSLANKVGILSIKDSVCHWFDNPFKTIHSNIWKKYVDKDGILWLNSGNGLIRYDSKVKKNQCLPYHALIRRVTVNSDSIIYNGYVSSKVDTMKKLEQSSIMQLDYNSNNLKFEYSSSFYETTDKVKYRHFLKGFETDTSVWEYEYVKEYTNLPNGTYCFYVQAKNIYDLKSDVAQYYFTISTPWYKSLIAILFYAIILVLFVYLIVKWNIFRLQRVRIRLSNLVKERTLEIANQNAELKNQAEEILSQRDFIEEKNDALLKAKEIIESQNKQLKNTNHELEERVKIRTKELHVAYKELDSFIYKSAHDLKGPISRIKGIANLMQQDELHPIQKSYMDRLNQAIREMYVLIFRLNKAYDVRNQEVRYQDLNLITFFRDYIATEKKWSEKLNIDLNFDPSNELKGQIDGDMLKIILDNILENAAVYGKVHNSKTNVAMHVQTKVNTHKKWLKLSIKDDGQGIDQTIKSNIFDMFYRGHERLSGVGLGLYEVLIIVRKLKGKVDLKKSDENGSLFVIKIPIDNPLNIDVY